LPHGIARVHDRRVISGIVFVIRNGLRWRDAPREYGPHKTIYNRFVHWSRLGVFNKIFAELARKAGKPSRLMIDAKHLKAHRTAASLLACSPTYRAHQGRSELEAAYAVVRDGPSSCCLAKVRGATTRGCADDRCAAARQAVARRQGLRRRLIPPALAERGIAACIPSKSNRKTPIEHDRVLYQQRRKIENMFGTLRDWRRIHTYYDRCVHTFMSTSMSAICIAAAVIFCSVLGPDTESRTCAVEILDSREDCAIVTLFC
jgi:transposase